MFHPLLQHLNLLETLEHSEAGHDRHERKSGHVFLVFPCEKATRNWRHAQHPELSWQEDAKDICMRFGQHVRVVAAFTIFGVGELWSYGVNDG